MATKFSAQDRRDLKELFRIYDFSKVERVDEIVSSAEKASKDPCAIFDEFYQLYQIQKLPKRDSAASHLRAAVPSASEADVESVMRETEMKGFAEKDAIRSLERRLGVRRMSNKGSAEMDSADLPSELLRVSSSLRHVNNSTSSIHLPRIGESSPVAAAASLDSPVKANLRERPSSQLSTTLSRDNLDEVMAKEVQDWLAKILGGGYGKEVAASSNFVDTLRNGVLLQVLLQKMEEPPVPDEEIKLPKRSTGFFIRDNVSIFLREAKKRFDLEDTQLFTVSDLVDSKSDRQVVTCLMSMAQIAYRAGTIKVAPSIVMLEQEIELLENRLSRHDIERLVQEAESVEDKASSPVSKTFANSPENYPEPREPNNGAASKQREALVEKSNESFVAKAGSSGHSSLSSQRSAPQQGSSPPSSPSGTRDIHGCQQDQQQQPEIEGGEGPDDAIRATQDGGKVFYLRDGALRPSEYVPEPPPELEDHKKKIGPRVVWKRPSASLSAHQPPRYHSRHWDGIDVMMGTHLNKHYANHPESPWRFRMVAANAGEYIVYNRITAQKQIIYARIIQQALFLRHSGRGKSWLSVDATLEEMEKEGRIRS